MPPYNAPYRRYSAPIAPSAAPAMPQGGGGLLDSLNSFRTANPGVLTAFGASLMGDSPMASGLMKTAGLQQANASQQDTAKYLLDKGLASDPQEAMLLASNPQLMSTLFKDNTIASQFGARKQIAEQMGITPGSPEYQRYVTTGTWSNSQDRAKFIAVGNGQVMNSDTGEFVSAPSPFGTSESTDPNDAPVMAPGQRDESYLQTLDPNTRAIIKGLVNYELDLPKVSSLRGNQRMQLAAAARRYDPSFDMTQYGARAAMRKSMTSGNYSQAINSANLVIQHLDALQKKIGKLGTGNYPLLNSGINLWSNQTGDASVKDFNTAADAAASELAKVFKGSGASSLQEIQEWRANLDPNSSPDQLKAAIQTAITQLLASRLDTIHSQFNAAMGRPADFTILTPHSKQILQGLGIDPAQMEQGGGNPIDGSGDPPPGGGDFKVLSVE